MDEPRRDVIAVDPALLKQFMLDDLYARVDALLRRPLPEHTERLLVLAADAARARAGYLTRRVEGERFAPAREPMPWLAALLADGLDTATVARQLADAEPAGKPSPNDARARMWQVPGPGGHVRYFLARRWCEGDEQLHRSWLYGFFVHCCEEASAR